MRAILKTEIVLETRGSQFGAILADALDVKIPAPCFVGKAIVTSDGYVQCNFIDQNGVARHSAFVGDVEDLVKNTERAADHFGLTGQDRADLFTAIREWIATDYSGKALQELTPCATA